MEDFDAHGTGELSVRYGEIVTVIEKNASGKTEFLLKNILVVHIQGFR